MDRHLAALLIGLSFRWFYHPTSRTPNLLNTVAERNRQSTIVLPPAAGGSVDIPDNVERRSRNTRLTRAGERYALYDITSSYSASVGPAAARGSGGGGPMGGTDQTAAGGSSGHGRPMGGADGSACGGSGGGPMDGRDQATAGGSSSHGRPIDGADGAAAVGSGGVSSDGADQAAAGESSGGGEQNDGADQVNDSRHRASGEFRGQGGNSDDERGDAGGSCRDDAGSSGAGPSGKGPSDAGPSGAGDSGEGPQVDDGGTATTGGLEGGETSSNGRARSRQQPRSSNNRPASPVARLDRYLKRLDTFNLHPIPGISRFLRQDNFTANELQLVGIENCGNVCPIISICLAFHRLRLRDQLMDPFLCINDSTKPTLVLHKILRALPSQHPFSIFQFILSWNKENLRPEIVQTSFGDVSELLESFLTNLAIKSFRSTPVFTKYVLSFHCRACGNIEDRLEHWSEARNKNLALLHVSDQEEDQSLHQLLDNHLSRPVEIRCPSLMCRSPIKDAELKAVPGMFSAICVNRLSYDRDLGLTKCFKRLILNSQSRC